MMRTIRLSLAGMVIAALLVGLGGTVAGQEGNATHVTGTLACVPAGKITMVEDDSAVFFQFPGRCTVTMSDPRVTGTMESELQEVCFKEADDACLFDITSELTGPQGTWVGIGGSVHDAALSALPAWATMAGTGAYEGWTFRFLTPRLMDPNAEVSGILYEGPPPPWSNALPLAPAE